MLDDVSHILATSPRPLDNGGTNMIVAAGKEIDLDSPRAAGEDVIRRVTFDMRTPGEGQPRPAPTLDMREPASPRLPSLLPQLSGSLKRRRAELSDAEDEPTAAPLPYVGDHTLSPISHVPVKRRKIAFAGRPATWFRRADICAADVDSGKLGNTICKQNTYVT